MVYINRYKLYTTAVIIQFAIICRKSQQLVLRGEVPSTYILM
jgi:hypothetical protein